MNHLGASNVGCAAGRLQRQVRDGAHPLAISDLKSQISKAFTLIELLVVVSIIVVLLALLMPAMDKAIYQAELAVCATHLHAIGSGAMTYAADNKRRYPYRQGVQDSTGAVNVGGTWLGGAWHPHKIWNGVSTGGNRRDDRALIRDYIPINGALNDPLAKKADLDGAKEGTSVYSTYYLWFGYKFAGQKGMNRLGDRFTWTESGNPPIDASFDLLAGDQDDVRYLDSLPGTTASHPDADGKLASELYENAGSPTSTLARWGLGGTNAGRGTMEMQFVFAGGDVRRFDKVELDKDERMIKVPVFNGATNTITQWTHLPSQR